MSDYDNKLDASPTDPATVLKRELQIDRRARVPGTPRPITDMALTQPGIANPLLNRPASETVVQRAPTAPPVASNERERATRAAVPPGLAARTTRTPPPQPAHAPSSGLAIQPEEPVRGGTLRMSPVTSPLPRNAQPPPEPELESTMMSQTPDQRTVMIPAAQVMQPPASTRPSVASTESAPTMRVGIPPSAPTMRVAAVGGAPAVDDTPAPTTRASLPFDTGQSQRTAITTAPEAPPAPLERTAVVPAPTRPPPPTLTPERTMTRPSSAVQPGPPTIEALPSALTRTVVPLGQQGQSQMTAAASPRALEQSASDLAAAKLNQPVAMPQHFKTTDPMNDAELVAEAQRRSAAVISQTEPAMDAKRVDAVVRAAQNNTQISLGPQFAVTQAGVPGPQSVGRRETADAPVQSPVPSPSDFEPSLGDAIDSEVRRLPRELLTADEREDLRGGTLSPDSGETELPDQQVGEVEALEVIARPASTFRRLGAWFIDFALYLVVVLGAALVLVQLKAPKLPVSAPPLEMLLARLDAARPFALILTAIALGSFWFFTMLFGCAFNARTPGRKLFGLHLLAGSGKKPGVLRAAWRATVSLLSVALAMMGFWASLFSRQGRTLHDALSGTIVVRVSAERS